MKLQVLIPLYNEEEAFYNCFVEINKVLRADGFEPSFVLVDDGSKDGTWDLISKLSDEFSNVRGIRFSRNFGKEIALVAGIDACEDCLTVIMDGDLQHPPKYIKTMFDEMVAGDFDIVEASKKSRGKESLMYKIFAKSFYKVLKLITGVDIDNSSDFKLMNAKVLSKLKDFNERHVFFRGLVDYVGFAKGKVDFEVEDRVGGKSSFSFKKLIMLAIDAVVSYTGKLLYLVFASSLLFLLFSIIMVINTLYNYFAGFAVSGFSTVIILV
ncbi:MAG: glycosyltransferase, partial [Clostridiales bacterium]